MATIFRPRTLILFLGDIFFLVFALWLSLYLRTFSLPSYEAFLDHLLPFSFLFAAWVVVFFIAGLYESRAIVLARQAFSTTLLFAQTFNIVLAALFFFLIPLFGIAPKTILLVYLVTSFFLILFWRTALFPLLGLQKPEHAVVIGSRDEISELIEALDRAPRAPARVAAHLEPGSPSILEDIQYAVIEHEARFIIADFSDPRVLKVFPDMYNLLAAGVRFFDAMALYEQVFGRIPLSILDDRWIARNVSRSTASFYDPLKRLMDILIALPALIVLLVMYPFIALALKIQDGKEVIIGMPRVGQTGNVFNLYKFRSMTGNDKAEYGSGGVSKLSVTKVGAILRASRLDEVPQLWNVLKGDVSLIGPRPEAPALVEEYTRQIPYYDFRHLVKPGLSGWAQLYHDNHPHHETEVAATREKLSYDLYYLKHRSLTLDIVIALKTIKKLLTRSGV
ncbi:MAG TPA: sugar transferase [Candidatus Paceibacterota bacterium]|nr:sugar transferase [Candidatus Paceibacterota bacterium]